MTATLVLFYLVSRFRFPWPGPRRREAGSAHIPASSRGALKTPTFLWSSENLLC